MGLSAERPHGRGARAHAQLRPFARAMWRRLRQRSELSEPRWFDRRVRLRSLDEHAATPVIARSHGILQQSMDQRLQLRGGHGLAGIEFRGSRRGWRVFVAATGPAGLGTRRARTARARAGVLTRVTARA